MMRDPEEAWTDVERDLFYATQSLAESRKLVEALVETLEAMTEGSTIRVYGVSYFGEQGKRRNSIALTDTARKKLIAALALYAKSKEEAE
jgi:hypothetical protein